MALLQSAHPEEVFREDWVVVPEGTPHWFTQIDGTLVLMSIHLPRAGGTASSR